MINKKFESNWDDQRVAFLTALLTQFRDGMPEMVSFDEDEVRKYQTIADGRSAFSEKCLEYAPQIAGIINFSQDDLRTMLQQGYDFKQLMKLRRLLESILKAVTQTSQFVGAELFESEGNFLDTVRLAVKRGKPGMSAVDDDLTKLFHGQGRKGKDDNGGFTDGDGPAT